MITVLFDNAQSSVLWGRVANRIPLLQSWLNPKGEPIEAHLLDWVFFLMDAAWGHDSAVSGTGENRRFQSRAERIEHRWRHNPDIYRLSVGANHLRVRTVFGSERRDFSLGRVRGMSAVIPLTLSGADRYLARQVAYGDLDSREIAAPSGGNFVSDVLLNTLIHFPSIRRLDFYSPASGELDGQFEGHGGGVHHPKQLEQEPSGATGFGVLVDLFAHVMQFVPPISLLGTGETRVKLRTEWSGRLPRLIAPVTGHGLGEPELIAAGFRSVGGDLYGNTVYVFDTNDLNQEEVEGDELDLPAGVPDRRERMLATVRLLNQLERE